MSNSMYSCLVLERWHLVLIVLIDGLWIHATTATFDHTLDAVTLAAVDQEKNLAMKVFRLCLRVLLKMSKNEFWVWVSRPLVVRAMIPREYWVPRGQVSELWVSQLEG